MADEWEEECSYGTSGKSFGGSYGKTDTTATTTGGGATTGKQEMNSGWGEDDAWQDDSNQTTTQDNGNGDNYRSNMNGGDRYNGGNRGARGDRGRGGRGGRDGGRGGGGGGGYKRNDDDNKDGGGYRGGGNRDGGYGGGNRDGGYVGGNRDGNRDGGYGGGGGYKRDGANRDGGGGGGGGGYGGNRDGGNRDGGFKRDGERNGYGNRNGRFEDGDNGDNNDRGGSRGGFRGGRGGRGGERGGRGGRDGGGGGGGGWGGENGGDRRGDRNGTGDDDDKTKDNKPRELYIPPEPTEDEAEIFNSGISSGINFDKYDKIPVNVSSGAPAAISTFEESGLRNFVLENITKSGYQRPTPIQKNAIPIIMNKMDLMACAQTGSGKTAAFLLPIVHTLLEENRDVVVGRPHCFIISPTRELAIQIFNEARKFALGSYLKIQVVYGGTGVKHQGNNIAKGSHIVVCTPGRLLDFVEKEMLSFEDVRFMVLDEADRMLDLGFMPSVEKVMNHSTMSPVEKRQTLMFSATFPEEIQRLAGQFLNNYIFLAIGIVGGACADVEQTFHKLTKFEKRQKLTQTLEESISEGGIMVFVETKRNADYLASLLSETKFPTTSIHGDRLQREREEALADFKSGKMGVLIATSVAARGLDIKHVAHVINYDLPKSIDEYVHRIGRTGRVGNCGKATSFYDPDQDSALAPDLVKILKQANQPVPDFLLSMGGGGGGGGGFRSNKFGGRDVRKTRMDANENAGYASATAAPSAQEPEEEW